MFESGEGTDVTTEMCSPALQRACTAFSSAYECSPEWMASAPGRVNVIGEFTDYNDGYVLPTALSCRTTILAAPNGTEHIRLRSQLTGDSRTLAVDEVPVPEPKGSWANYIKGVLAGFLESGLQPRGFDALIDSDVPVGAGLSSSAALEVAFATLLERACETRMDPIEKALLCQKAEVRYAQVPCGIMDPFISTLGRAGELMLLDCRSRQSLWLRFDDPAAALLVINTRVKHELATNAYATRRLECSAAASALGVTSLRDATLERLMGREGQMDPVIFRRAYHVVTEIERTLQAARCVRERDWERLGNLFDSSHRSLSDNYAVSCTELDIVVKIAQSIGRRGGVYGCRMTGGGFGGCAVALIESARLESISSTIHVLYRERTRITPDLMLATPSVGAQFSEI